MSMPRSSVFSVCRARWFRMSGESAGGGGGGGGRSHSGGNDAGHGHGNDRKTVQKVYLGKYIMDTWYYRCANGAYVSVGSTQLVRVCSPFPPEYEGYHELWFCEFTLRFFRSKSGWLRHHVSSPVHLTSM